MIPESAEVRAEHWRRGNLFRLLPSREYLRAASKRLQYWVLDHYLFLMVSFFVLSAVYSQLESWYKRRAHRARIIAR